MIALIGISIVVFLILSIVLLRDTIINFFKSIFMKKNDHKTSGFHTTEIEINGMKINSLVSIPDEIPGIREIDKVEVHGIFVLKKQDPMSMKKIKRFYNVISKYNEIIRGRHGLTYSNI